MRSQSSSSLSTNGSSLQYQDSHRKKLTKIVLNICKSLIESLISQSSNQSTSQILSTLINTTVKSDLNRILEDFQPKFIEYRTIASIKDEYLTKFPKDHHDFLEILYKAVFVLIKSYDSSLTISRFSKEKLIERYPESADLFEEQPEEYSYLREFHYYFLVALKIIPVTRSKGLLIKIASLLEGSYRTYKTGGGQSILVTLREMIYERETGHARVTRNRPRKQARDTNDETQLIASLSTTKRVKFNNTHNDVGSDLSSQKSLKASDQLMADSALHELLLLESPTLKEERLEYKRLLQATIGSDEKDLETIVTSDLPNTESPPGNLCDVFRETSSSSNSS